MPPGDVHAPLPDPSRPAPPRAWGPFPRLARALRIVGRILAGLVLLYACMILILAGVLVPGLVVMLVLATIILGWRRRLARDAARDAQIAALRWR